jgi:hypothetical protein
MLKRLGWLSRCARYHLSVAQRGGYKKLVVWSLILWVALLASITASPDVMKNLFGGIISPGAYEYVYVLLLLAFPIEITTWLCDVGIMAYIAHHFRGYWLRGIWRALALARLPLIPLLAAIVFVGIDDYLCRSITEILVVFSASGLFVGGMLVLHTILRRRWRRNAIGYLMFTCVTALTFYDYYETFQSTLHPRNAQPWSVTTIDNITCFHAADQPLDATWMKRIPEVQSAVGTLWGNHLPSPQRLSVYFISDSIRLQKLMAVIMQNEGEDVGVYLSVDGAMVLAAGNWTEQGSVFVHEYVHAVNATAYSAYLHASLDEGMAVYTERQLAEPLGFTDDWKNMPPSGLMLSDLTESHVYDGEHGYEFAAEFVTALIREYGQDNFHRFTERLQSFGGHQATEAHYKRAFNLTYGELYPQGIEYFILEKLHYATEDEEN